MQSEMNAPAALIKIEVETSSPPKRKISRKAQLTHVQRRDTCNVVQRSANTRVKCIDPITLKSNLGYNNAYLDN